VGKKERNQLKRPLTYGSKPHPPLWLISHQPESFSGREGKGPWGSRGFSNPTRKLILIGLLFSVPWLTVRKEGVWLVPPYFIRVLCKF
jgi:hypothetical protein